MALIEEFDRSGSWLFRWRSFLPVILYVFAAVVIASGQDVHVSHFDLSWALVCIAVALFGQMIRVITIGYTPRGTSGRNTREGQVAETLNTKGIYSIVRHPLYLGNFFMWLGIILYVGNWWFAVVCCLLFWLYYERIMFTEEYFLRKKFADQYLKWSEKVPAFFPKVGNWKSPEVYFSLRNVLKREYNGFFAMFVSFVLIDIMKNYFHGGYYSWVEIITPFWWYTLIVTFLIFVILRSLKKYSRVLDVKGREYVKD